MSIINITINNKLELHTAKLKIKFFYTSIIDDIITCNSGSSEYIQLDSSTIKRNFSIKTNSVEVYKIRIYLPFNNKIYRYEFKHTFKTLNFIIEITMGNIRPIIRVNNQSADDLELMRTDICCFPSNNPENYLDNIVYARDHPEPDSDFCLIS
jgi:hypothetical protein